MASAIPVPGQPGRLYIPGVGVIDQRFRSGRPVAGMQLYGGHMKLSDVSMGQLDEQEQEQLNGLGYSRAEGSTLKSQSNAITKPLVQAQQAVLDEQKKQAAALIAAQQTALAKKTDAQPAPGPTAPAAAPSYGSGYDWAALFKNPWYWAGVAAVVGVGFYLFTRSRRTAQPVGAVETLALEGTKKPRRKRRKSKKAKA